MEYSELNEQNEAAIVAGWWPNELVINPALVSDVQAIPQSLRRIVEVGHRHMIAEILMRRGNPVRVRPDPNQEGWQLRKVE